MLINKYREEFCEENKKFYSDEDYEEAERKFMIRIPGRMTPALLGLVALALVLWTPGLGLAASDDVSNEQSVRWYDPSDWFNKGGNLPHESQWYNDTYGQHVTAESMPAHSAQGAHPCLILRSPIPHLN